MYKRLAELHGTYGKTNKHEDLDEFDSFFVEKDKKAANAWGFNASDAGRPPYK
jgi:hypothetical protein